MEFDPLSRLIIISNRVSAPSGSKSGAQGGLAVALASALREYKGMWFGWSGEQTDEYTGQITFQRSEGVTTATVDLEEQDISTNITTVTPTGRFGRCSTIASISRNMNGNSPAATSASTNASPTPSSR